MRGFLHLSSCLLYTSRCVSETGPKRIVEVKLEWTDSREILLEQGQQAQERAREICTEFNGKSDFERLDFVQKYLGDHVRYDDKAMRVVTETGGPVSYTHLDVYKRQVLGAYGVSITTFVGQNFGAQQYHRVRKSIWVCMGMAAVTTILFSVLFYFAASPLIGLFSTDQAVLAEGVDIMRFLAPWYIAYVCIEIFSGAIREMCIRDSPCAASVWLLWPGI